MCFLRWAELDGVDVHKAQQTGIVSEVLLLPIATLPPQSSNPDSCKSQSHPTYTYIEEKPSTIHILFASLHEFISTYVGFSLKVNVSFLLQLS